jgi:hypothetical protein
LGDSFEDEVRIKYVINLFLAHELIFAARLRLVEQLIYRETAVFRA